MTGHRAERTGAASPGEASRRKVLGTLLFSSCLCLGIGCHQSAAVPRSRPLYVHAQMSSSCRPFWNRPRKPKGEPAKAAQTVPRWFPVTVQCRAAVGTAKARGPARPRTRSTEDGWQPTEPAAGASVPRPAPHCKRAQRSQDSRVRSQPGRWQAPLLVLWQSPYSRKFRPSDSQKRKKKKNAFPLPLQAFPFGKDFVNILRKSPLSLVFPQVRDGRCFRNSTSHTNTQDPVSPKPEWKCFIH